MSKDADFYHLSMRFGAPPKVIWLKLGNASTTEILQAVLRSELRIRTFLAESESTLMVITPLRG